MLCNQGVSVTERHWKDFVFVWRRFIAPAGGLMLGWFFPFCSFLTITHRHAHRAVHSSCESLLSHLLRMRPDTLTGEGDHQTGSEY